MFAASGVFGFEVVIQKPDSSYLQDPNVDFKFTITDDSGACVIYSEDHNGVDMSGTNGQKTFQLGNTLLQTYPNPMVTTLTIDQVFSSSGVVYNCQGGGTYTSTASASRKVVMEFNDGSGLQTLPAMAINSVPYAVEAQKVVSNSITTQNILDGTITAADLSSMGAATGQVMKWNGSAWVASNDNSGSGLVSSVAGRTGAVVLSSSDISGLGTLAGKNQIQLSTDVTGFLPLANLAQSSATTGQVIKWNGSAWVASDDASGAGGSVTNVTASGPLSSSGGSTPNITIAQASGTTSGYLSSSDYSTFAAKLADFSTLTSADITAKLGYTPLANFTSMTSNDVTTALGYTPLASLGSLTSADVTTALGYTPVNPATAVISVAGRTGTVTLSSSDISGIGFGTTSGTFAQGNDARFTDERNPINNSVTSVKIADGTIQSADLSAGSVTLDKLNQSAATTGQVIKWNGSAWVVSDDSSGLSDFLSLTSADITGKLGYTPLANFTSMTSTDVTTALAYTPLSPSTSFSGDISGVYNNITVNKIKNVPVTLSSLTSGDIVQYNGSAFVNRNIPTCAANQYLTFNGTSYSCVTDVGASGTVGSVNTLTGALSLVTGTAGTNFNIDSTGTTITLNMPTASSANRGLLSSADWTTFNSKLSDFTTLTSADITGKLGYTPLANFTSMTSNDVTTALGYNPVNPATAVISVAGRTGAVTLSSSDISGISFGTTSGTFAQGNDARFTDERTPINNSVTSAKIADGTIVSADISAGAITFDKLNQSAATTGQVIKWNGSAWVVSDDSSGAGTVTSVTASGPLSSSGGATPNITIAQANGTTSGYLSSADFSTFAAKLSDFSTLTSADITGKLGYTPLANFTSMVSGDVTTALGYVPANVGSVILASQMPANCNAGQTLTFSSPTGSWVCSSIVLANNSVTSSMISSLDWSKVVNTPSNLAGYGVTLVSNDITTALGYTPVNPATAVISVAGRTGAVTLSSADISGLGTLAGKNQVNLSTDVTGTLSLSNIAQSAATTGQVIKWNGSAWVASGDSGLTNFTSMTSNDVTTALAYTPLAPSTSFSGDISGVYNNITVNRIKNIPVTLSSITSGDIVQYNGTAFVNRNIPTCAANQYLTFNGTSYSCVTDVGASGTVGSINTLTGALNLVTGTAGTNFNIDSTGTTITLNMPTASSANRGLLSSADWSLFNAKLSDFTTLTSSDITSKLGYTPVNPATAVISVAGRTGAVTLSSSDISGIGFGTTSGTFAQGNDPRFTDERNPINNSVTSAKIADGTIVSADISAGAITFDKLNQSSATTGQVIKWNGSAWIASSDSGLATLASADITTALTYTPVNKSGDTMTGGLNLPSNGLAVGTNQLVTSGGFVGIGTASPSDIFHVKKQYSNIVFSEALYGSGQQGAYAPSITLSGSSGVGQPSWDGSTKLHYTALGFSISHRGTVAGGQDQGPLGLGLATGGRDNDLYIDSTGRVGIGMTAPSYALDVSGDVNVTGNFRLNGTLLGSGTVTAVTASGPLSSSGGTAPNISIAQASGTTSGYLSSADWTTFNSKQAALGYTPLNPANNLSDVSNVATARTNLGLGTGNSPTLTGLTLSGVAGNTLVKTNGSGVLSNATSTDVTGLLGYTPANGASYVAKAGDTMTGTLNLPSNGLAVGTSQLVVNSGNVGIGTTSPGSKLTISEGDFRIANDTVTGSDIQIDNHFDTSEGPFILLRKTRGNKAVQTYSQVGDSLGAISFQNKDYVEGASIVASTTAVHNGSTANAALIFKTTSGTTPQTRMMIDEVGRVSIGVPTPNYSLDVSGDVNITGNFRVNGSILATGSGTVSSGTTNKLAYYTGATTVSSNTNMSVSSGALTLGTAGSALGSLAVTGNTSGTVTIQPQAAAGTYNFNLPTTAGTSGQVLTSGGGVGAPMTWLTLANSASVDTTNASNITSGTLPAGRLPAFTGDVTTTAGSSATTIANNAVTAAKLESGTNGQLFIGNGTGFTKATLTGTANQVSVANGSGTITLSTPQNIHSAATPTFAGLTLSGVAGNTLVKTNGSGVLSNATSTDVTGLLGYTPANGASYVAKAGDTMTGTLNLPANGLVLGTNQLVASGGFVGVGTASPSYSLDVQSSNSFQARLFHSSNNQFDGAAMMLTRTRGTLGSNTAVGAADTIGGLYFRAHDGSGTGTTNSTIEVSAGEAHTTSARGTTMIFETTKNGATARGERMRIHSNGNVGIGGVTAPAYSVDVSGDVNITGNFRVNGSILATGSGTVSSGTTNKLAYYTGATTVSSNTNMSVSSGALTLGTAGSALGSLAVTGNTSGTVTIQPQAAAGTYNFNLPTTAGTSGQVLTSGGGASAPMTWLTLANSASVDTTNATNITSGTLPAGRLPAHTGDVTSSAGSAALSIANNAVTSAKILDGTIVSADISSAAITFDKLNQSSATTGQVIKWNGSAWIASNDVSGASSQWTTSSGDIYFNTGRVGIGTNSPTANLHVQAASDPAIIESTGANTSGRLLLAGNTGSGTTEFGGIAFKNMSNLQTNSVIKAVTEATVTAGALTFETGTSNTTAERMRITSTGNVGIGTASPSYALEVAGGSGYYSGLFRGTNTTTRLGVENSAVAAWGNAAELEFRLDGNDRGKIAVVTTNSAAESYDMTFHTKTSNFPYERMRIRNDGYVGIGTASPYSMLDVAGSVKVGTDSTACSNNLKGALRLNSSVLEFCNGTSWGTLGGLTNFTESVNTSAPNATVPAVQLAVTNAATHADIVISPKGAGAILAQIPDNTATGGDKRGVRAVDFQTSRTSSSMVASGSYSVLMGGFNNSVSGSASFLGAGSNNWTNSGSAFVGAGTNNNVQGSVGAVVAGYYNSAQGLASFVGAGYQNQAIAENSAILAGSTNVSSGIGSSVIGGSNNTASGNNATVTGNNATSESYAQLTIGRYNLPLGTETAGSWVATDPLFVIGNGTGSGASRSNAMTVLKNGKVGIGGITSPAYAVTVSGDVSATGSFKVNGVSLTSGLTLTPTVGTVTAPGYSFSGDSNTGLYSEYPDTISISTAGTRKVYIDDVGYVGIGVPTGYANANKLHVQGGVNAALFTTTDFINGSTGSSVQIRTGTDTGNTYGIIKAGISGASSPGKLAINPDGGSVGIGITNPSYAVDVSGDVNVTGNFKVNGVNLASGSAMTPAGGTASAPGYAFSGDTNTGLFSSTADTLGFSTAGTERMTIASDGKVGVGVSTGLQTPFEVQGTATGINTISATGGAANLSLTTKRGAAWADANSKIWNISALSDSYVTSSDQNDFWVSYWDGTTPLIHLKIDSVTGNLAVGSGVINDGKVTSVKNSTYNTEMTEGLAISSSESAGATKLAIGTDNTNSMSYIQSLQRGTSYSTRPLVLQPNAGNVGVGTINPGRLLTVNGSVDPAISITNPGINWTANQRTAFSANANEAGNLFNINNTNGGLILRGQNGGVASGAIGVWLDGLVENDPSSAASAILLNAAKHDGAGAKTTIGATGQLLTVANNRTQLMTVLGNGNVGIGVTNPARVLHVKDTVGSPAILFEDGAAGTTNKWAVGSGAGSVTDGKFFIYDHRQSLVRMTIDTAGNAGIGTSTNPTHRLTIEDAQASNAVAFFNNTNTGTTAQGIKIRVGASTPGTGNDFVVFEKSGGTVIGQIEAASGTTVQYTTTSDRRLKENIQNTHYSIEDLLKIKVKDYNYKSNPGQPMTGFIAQELYEVYPYAVSKPQDDQKEFWGVDYGLVTPLLVKGVQDIYGMCKGTESKVEQLSRQVASVKAETEAALAAKDKEIAELKQMALKAEKENAAMKNRLDQIEKMLRAK